MIRWLYGDMNIYDKERIIKFLLCTVLGLCFAWLIGEPHSATPAVTANLVLYVDRGYGGSLKYSWKRIEVQLIQGGITFVIIFFGKNVLRIALPDTVFAIIASFVAIVIGLPLNYKHQIAPLDTTLANATFIMACGSLQRLSFFPFRVLHCVAGAAIAFLVNWIIMPRHDRYSESIASIEFCSAYLFAGILSFFGVREESDASHEEYLQARALLMKHLQILPTDNGRELFQKTIPKERLTRLLALGASVELLATIQEDVEIYGNEFSPSFRDDFLDAVQQIQRAQQAALACPGQAFGIRLVLCPKNERYGEMILAGHLYRLANLLQQKTTNCADVEAGT